MNDVWGPLLLLGALSIAAPALAGNPDGIGQVDLGVQDAAALDGARGLQFQSDGLQQDIASQVSQDLSWQASGALPLGPAWTLLPGFSTGHALITDSISDSTDAHGAKQADVQSMGLGLGLRLYLAGLFGRDWHPKWDHPQGATLWPVLSLNLGWSQESWQYSVTDATGYLVGLPPDVTTQSLSWGLGLLLPLTQRWAWSLGCGEAGDPLRNPSLGAFTNGNASAALDSGLSVSLPWREDDLGQDYFPGLGRPGRVVLSVGWGGHWDTGSGAQQDRTLQLSLAAPLGWDWALAGGWSSRHPFQGWYDGVAGVSGGQDAPDPQWIFLNVGYCFGDAAFR